VLFIDEIDAVGRRRSGSDSGASLENNQTLNALLQKMDGLGIKNNGIFVIGATNRIEDLDPALLRPGRFDKKLYIGVPQYKKDRDAIVQVHLKNKRLAPGLDFDQVSKDVFGMSGAEIAEVMNEAALMALQEEREGYITNKDVSKAAMKLRVSGVEVTYPDEQDKKVAAVHEAGHTLTSLLLGRQISQVSIIPYSSGVGGVTVADTDHLENRRFKTTDELQQDIQILLAGRCAELLILGNASIGCRDDLKKATELAFTLVNSYAVTSGNFVDMTILAEHGLLADTQNIIDTMNTLIAECSDKTTALLEVYKGRLEELYTLLMDKEVLTTNDLYSFIPE